MHGVLWVPRMTSSTLESLRCPVPASSKSVPLAILPHKNLQFVAVLYYSGYFSVST